MGSGFSGDNHGGEMLHGLYLGTIINRDDPDGNARVRVRIPGMIEQSNWARPKGGGHKQWGSNDVPPLDADVYVQFINGNPELPVYEPADHGVRPQADGQEETERFPEFEGPDVHVWGRGPFRLVVDNREGQRQAMMKIVREVNDVEEDVVWIAFNYEDNSLLLHVESALGLEGTILDAKFPTIQLNGRKLVPNGKPVN